MTHFSRCVAYGVLVAALCGTAGTSAQTPQTPQIPGARERIPGPLIDFTAMSATGMPVTDLAASEVEVRVDGRPRRIRQLRAISAAPAATGRLARNRFDAAGPRMPMESKPRAALDWTCGALRNR